MMLKLWTSLTLLLAASLEVNAHAAVSPVLGLGSTAPQRSDVKRPSPLGRLSPCGRGVDVASALAKSTPIQAAADGTFTATVTNFNRRLDGSRQMKAKVDASATGDNFEEMTVTQNGEARPAELGSEQLVAALPAGMKCTGGATGDICLVQFRSLSGFGNCVAIQQGAGGDATENTGTNSTSTETGSATDTTDSTNDSTGNSGNTGVGSAGGATGGATSTNTGSNKNANANANASGNGNGATGTQNNQNFAKGRLAQGGSRAARALLDLEERGEEVVNSVRRGLGSWIWA